MPWSRDDLLRLRKNLTHYKLCTYCRMYFWRMSFRAHYDKERRDRGLPTMPRSPTRKR